MEDRGSDASHARAAVLGQLQSNQGSFDVCDRRGRVAELFVDSVHNRKCHGSAHSLLFSVTVFSWILQNWVPLRLHSTTTDYGPETGHLFCSRVDLIGALCGNGAQVVGSCLRGAKGCTEPPK